MTVSDGALAGAYGKVPTAGDFVTRGLPSAFVKPWDQWLAKCIHTAREHFDDGFQLIYLTSPVWCFILDKNLAGPVTWLGALATSVDSHQRPFPITLAVGIEAEGSATELAEAASPYSGQLEELCFSAIDGTLEWDEIAVRLTTLAEQVSVKPAVRWAYVDNFGVTRARMVSGITSPPISSLTGALTRAPSRSSTAITCWWHRGTAERSPEAVRSVGLPTAQAFLAFLDGDWSAHGWSDGS